MRGYNIKKLYKWLDEYKNNDDVFILLLKLLYSFSIKDATHPIISMFLTVLISVLLAVDNKNALTVWFWLIVAFWLFETIGYNICILYQRRNFQTRKMYERIISDTDKIINSIGLFVQNNNTWKTHIFKKTCNLVSQCIYDTLYAVYGAKVRVSVEYQFTKEGEKFSKMISRCSVHHCDPQNKSFKLVDSSKKFFQQVLKGNKIGVHFINKDEFVIKKWYINEAHGKSIIIKQYIGIAASINDTDVAYILQIDSLNKSLFGDTLEEAESFADIFIKPYINIISMAYTMNTDKYGNIPEV